MLADSAQVRKEYVGHSSKNRRTQNAEKARTMKIHKSFADIWLHPTMEIHKKYVTSVYPNAHFVNGFIYDGTSKLTGARWDLNGVEAEYYAWMWAYQLIGEEMLRKFES